MCEGEKISADCIVLNNTSSCKPQSLSEVIETLTTDIELLKKEPDVDLKTLSTEPKDLASTLQILVDEIQKLKNSQSNTTNNNTNSTTNTNINCNNIDWSYITDCNNCNLSFCEKLQMLIDKVAIIEQNM